VTRWPSVTSIVLIVSPLGKLRVTSCKGATTPLAPIVVWIVPRVTLAVWRFVVEDDCNGTPGTPHAVTRLTSTITSATTGERKENH
jgi:hypothetical protein